MASYIFGEKILEHPVFISFSACKDYLSVAECHTKDNKTGAWTAKLLQEYASHPFLKKCLREGIHITLSNNDTIYLKVKGMSFFRCMHVYLDKNRIKGRHFSKHKIIY